MLRKTALEKLAEIIKWDTSFIGGGATGLGIAVDAAQRRYKTLLAEQADFARGKWTIYRKMAEDILSKIIAQKKLIPTTYNAANLSILYSSNKTEIVQLTLQNPNWQKRLLSNMEYTWAHIAFALQYEMAETIEDILARRTRILFLDSMAAISLAPIVASFMAELMQKNEAWQKNQITQFTKLAKEHYSLQ